MAQRASPPPVAVVGAGVRNFYQLGALAFVAAGAVVTSDIPDYGSVAGVPARLVGWMCSCGVKLNVSRDAASNKTAGCACRGLECIKNAGLIRRVTANT